MPMDLLRMPIAEQRRTYWDYADGLILFIGLVEEFRRKHVPNGLIEFVLIANVSSIEAHKDCVLGTMKFEEYCTLLKRN